MDAETSWQVITEQRLSLADLLQGLTAEEGETPSLCVGWRVRDVAAHVTMTPQAAGIATMIGDSIRARGSFNRLNPDLAVRHAARPTAQIVSELRQHAESRRLPIVTSYRNILPDILVHGQDIAIPLGRHHAMPVAAARAAATRVWRMGWPFWARRRLHRLQLTATDTDWSTGAGEAEVNGPID